MKKNPNIVPVDLRYDRSTVRFFVTDDAQVFDHDMQPYPVRVRDRTASGRRIETSITYRVQGVRKGITLHRLVAMGFHGLKQHETYLDVHHIDDDCTNNSADNLAVLTKAEHMAVHR